MFEDLQVIFKYVKLSPKSIYKIINCGKLDACINGN